MHQYSRKRTKHKQENAQKENKIEFTQKLIIEVHRSKKRIETFQLVINIIASIATALTLLVMFLTLLEMNKQRLVAYMPNITLVPSCFKIEFDENVFDLYGVRVLSINSLSQRIRILNLGKGVANNIRILWDAQEFINKMPRIIDLTNKWLVEFYSNNELSIPVYNNNWAFALLDDTKNVVSQGADVDVSALDKNEYIENRAIDIRSRLNFECSLIRYASDTAYYDDYPDNIDYIFEQNTDDSEHYIFLPEQLIRWICLLSDPTVINAGAYIPAVYINITYYDIFGTEYSREIVMDLFYSQEQGNTYANLFFKLIK